MRVTSTGLALLLLLPTSSYGSDDGGACLNLLKPIPRDEGYEPARTALKRFRLLRAFLGRLSNSLRNEPTQPVSPTIPPAIYEFAALHTLVESGQGAQWALREGLMATRDRIAAELTNHYGTEELQRLIAATKYDSTQIHQTHHANELIKGADQETTAALHWLFAAHKPMLITSHGPMWIWPAPVFNDAVAEVTDGSRHDDFERQYVLDYLAYEDFDAFQALAGNTAIPPANDDAKTQMQMVLHAYLHLKSEGLKPHIQDVTAYLLNAHPRARAIGALCLEVMLEAMPQGAADTASAPSPEATQYLIAGYDVTGRTIPSAAVHRFLLAHFSNRGQLARLGSRFDAIDSITNVVHSSAVVGDPSYAAFIALLQNEGVRKKVAGDQQLFIEMITSPIRLGKSRPKAEEYELWRAALKTTALLEGPLLRGVPHGSD